MGFLRYFKEADRDPDPIDTNAWTLQEYELSPQILSFKVDHFSFLCQNNSTPNDIRRNSGYKKCPRASTEDRFNPPGVAGAQAFLKTSG
jgi:hypothetical protein